MPSQALIIRLATALFGLAALASCNRRTLGNGHDAGNDTGAPSAGDGGSDVSVADALADATRDLGADAPPAVCPAAAPPLDVCGCGCCGGAPGTTACYYPSLGQSRDAIPNPMPTPQECATTGCSEGVHYLCCADTGPDSSMPAVCAIDTSIEDQARFTITRRDGDICTTLELGGAAPMLPLVTGPPGWANVNAWRAPCLPLMAPQPAIGGLGQVTPGASGTLLPFPRYDVHVVLFFDHGGGTADAVRIDRDEVAVAPRCSTTVCPVCGSACAFDATYTYGFTGGHVAFVDEVTLAPPASYEHRRSPVSTMPPDITCAPPPPACGGTAIDVGDIMAAVADPDVQQALSRSLGPSGPGFYGVDPRPTDGSAFQFVQTGGGAFLIGGPCPAGSTSCTDIPGGLARLQSLLTAFDRQQLQSDPACAPLRP